MNMNATKLTEAQRRVLKNIKEGRRIQDGFAAGRSTAGGLTGTVASLWRRGYLNKDGITEGGIRALAAEERA